MGTDWVTLFDLDLAKEVTRLDAPGLARFLASRGRALAERDVRNAREMNAELAAEARAMARGLDRVLSQLGVPLRDREPEPARIAELDVRDVRRAAARWDELGERLRRGEELGHLRTEVAWAAGELSNQMNVDYWGCAAEALPLDIHRTCETNLVIDPDDLDGAHTYFLLAPHVDAMIVSLRAHWSEVRLMDEADLKRLIAWRDRCATEPAIRVAYHVDF